MIYCTWLARRLVVARIVDISSVPSTLVRVVCLRFVLIIAGYKKLELFKTSHPRFFPMLNLVRHGGNYQLLLPQCPCAPMDYSSPSVESSAPSYYSVSVASKSALPLLPARSDGGGAAAAPFIRAIGGLRRWWRPFSTEELEPAAVSFLLCFAIWLLVCIFNFSCRPAPIYIPNFLAN